ncbi:peroxidasin homolog pxn-1-like isoform X4 [Mytilus californianus]|uniref:peroxidasin homolog pxn-1-like isoform X1 n=2 Tax=Mytilus californianus TaxID=6549 RepID=UPI0022458D17|nr:peroxidasin homolog pxn-1-like isoform X1 [Mytilus californianus]XP_052095047.1 peroxidasin homolog pxn-1-like isoform X2 [Mytilus californianus]XP_052095049.1 peroxidasin homolog pxn-1-like isoform X4 [Mytilus californianus]
MLSIKDNLYNQWNIFSQTRNLFHQLGVYSWRTVKLAAVIYFHKISLEAMQDVVTTTILLLINYASGNLDEMMPNLPNQEPSSVECPGSFTCNTDDRDRYRTANGACNNLISPSMGMSFTPQARFIPPMYSDGDAPRDYHDMPSARLVSNKLFDAKNTTIFSTIHTVQLMAYGQFLAHDMAATPGEGADLDCCNHTNALKKDCYAIPVPHDDPFFKNITCLNFVRSSAADKSCMTGQREQMNDVTSFIDGCMVYGSTEEHMSELRDTQGGLLKMSPSGLLPENPNGDCRKNLPEQHCHLAGDSRVDEIPHLGMNHLLLVRQHNAIAKKLQEINPNWSNEIVFQETRKIIIALIQHITYKEYLPIMLGKKAMNRHSLRISSGRNPFNDQYDQGLDPRIRNSFATAALRIGHTLIVPSLAYLSSEYGTLYRENLDDNFFSTHMILKDDGQHTDNIARWLTHEHCMKADRFFQPEVRNKLFKLEGTSHDLAARNIQRGRDHGLPDYNTWRQFCGLIPIKFSDDPIFDHDKESSDKIKELYRHESHIDLYAGAISETAKAGSLLGPTFQCIFVRQFQALKSGDRHWYERPRGKAGFTRDQLNSIKSMRLSKMFCDNFNLTKIQPNAFLKRGRKVYCKDVPSLNLELWKDMSQ